MNEVLQPRLAIVEDDPDQRESLLTWLDIRGYRVWGVESAESFYRELAVSPADILLLDIGLPGESGLDVIRHLRDSGIIRGVIVTSAHGERAARQEALKLGADVYLVKPVDLDDLLMHIDVLWSRVAGTTQGNALWSINKAARELVSPQGMAVSLTPSELVLLVYMASKEEPVHRQELAVALGANLAVFDLHRIDVHLSRLRSKVRQRTSLNLPVASTVNQQVELTQPIVIEG